MMSGVYKVVGGRVVKVSDRIPNVSEIFNAAFTSPYYSPSLNTWVDSREQKRSLMKQQGLSEYDPSLKQQQKVSTEEKAKQIESFVAGYLNDRGVERIKLKDV